MQTTKIFKTMCICGMLFALNLINSHAQTVWTNKLGGDWNTAINWSNNLVPIETTNVFITNSSALTVTYTTPMAASSIGSLTLGGFGVDVLAITASGFNVAGTTTLNANGILNVGSGGVMTNGALNEAIQSSAVIVNGGTMTNGTTQVSNNGSNDGGPLMITNGAVANLGNVTTRRSGATLFSSGFTIRNSTVTANNVTIGNGAATSFNTMSVGGFGSSPATIMNIAGILTIGNATSTTIGRQYQYMQTNGIVTAQTLNMGSGAAIGEQDWFTVQGSAVFNVTGIAMFPNVVTSVTNNFTNTATIYLGGSGFTLPNLTGNGYNVSLNDQGLFGASADWSGGFDATLRNGVFTFQCADSIGAPHNITLSGGLRGGTGVLNKTGGGTLTLNGTNTYPGNTLINNGTLLLGASGTLSNSLQIIVGSGTTFDVSAVSGGFILNNGQTLAGSGIVNGSVMVISNAIVNPGSNTVTGTLNFSSSLNEAGNAINHFDLSSSPSSGNNDLISITGDLTVSGTNTVQISGSPISGTNYTLIQYTGNFNGDVTNFNLTGVTGYLTNIVATKSIAVHTLVTARGPANLVWVGNATLNNWDLGTTTNWSNAGILDSFLSGDSVLFNSAGAANTNVNLVSSLMPASVTVDSTANYTFAGSGSIDGSGGITKTNSGTLTILTVNNYTGPTIISGGTLEALTISNSLSPSSLGAANNDPARLVLTNGGILRYIGSAPAITDRGITLNGSGGAIAVTNGVTLTLNSDFAGTGTLTKTDNGELVLNAPNGNPGGVVVNSGILTLANANGAGAGVITNNDGTTLKVATSLSGGATSIGNALNFNGTVTIDLNNLAGTENLDGAWSGNATVNIINQSPGQIFTIGGGGNGGGAMFNFIGTVNAGTNSGSIRFNDSAHQNTGTTNLMLNLGTGSEKFLVRDGDFTNDIGALLGGPNTMLSGRGSAGTIATYSIGGKNISTEFDGVITNGAGNNPTAIIKVGTGTLTLSGQSVYSGTTTISNGVLALVFNGTSDGSIGSSTIINIVSGAFLDVSGRNDDTMPLGSSQQLRGNGTINGKLDTTGGGTVAPGNGTSGSPGLLTVTNSINLGGTAWMKLNRTNALTSDRLVSSLSSITYGGTLVVTNAGPKLQVGDTFTLFSGTSPASGSFTLQLPSLYDWDTSELAANGTITVTAVLLPPTFSSIDTSLLASDGLITLNAAGGAPNGVVNLLSSTNLAPPIAQWTTEFNGNFDGSGNFNITIVADPNAPQEFYILQAQ